MTQQEAKLAAVVTSIVGDVEWGERKRTTILAIPQDSPLGGMFGGGLSRDIPLWERRAKLTAEQVEKYKAARKAGRLKKYRGKIDRSVSRGEVVIITPRTA